VAVDTPLTGAGRRPLEAEPTPEEPLSPRPGRPPQHGAYGFPSSERNVARDFKRVLRLTWPKAHDEDPEPSEWDFSPHSLRHSFATLHLGA
jgi:integrase